MCVRKTIFGTAVSWLSELIARVQSALYQAACLISCLFKGFFERFLATHCDGFPVSTFYSATGTAFAPATTRITRYLTTFKAADIHLALGNPHRFQMLEHIIWHARGKIYNRVFIKDLDAADKLTLDVRFVGDRAYDIAGLHLMCVPDFNPVAIHPFFRC